MPVMSGIELASRFSAWLEESHVTHKPYIIASTASCEKSVINRALSVGCSDYLTKPVMKDILLQKLKEIVSEKICHPIVKAG